MPKLKSHKGLLKRVKVTAKGKVKWRKSNNGHLRSVKTGDKIRQLRRKGVAKSGDIKRLSKMLHRPLTAADAGE
jgi:large subunit ribosomal protein L35